MVPSIHQTRDSDASTDQHSCNISMSYGPLAFAVVSHMHTKALEVSSVLQTEHLPYHALTVAVGAVFRCAQCTCFEHTMPKHLVRLIYLLVGRCVPCGAT